jgi:hypothetical protein
MHLPQRWVSHAGASDVVRCGWPLRLPDLTLGNFFVWGYICIKDMVFVLSQPWSLPEMRQQITAAIASFTRGRLTKVWDELDLCLSVRHVIHRAHDESLWDECKSLSISLLDCCRCEACSLPLSILYHFESVLFFCGHSVLSFHKQKYLIFIHDMVALSVSQYIVTKTLSKE